MENLMNTHGISWKTHKGLRISRAAEALLDAVGIPFAPLPLLCVLRADGHRTLLRAGEELAERGRWLRHIINIY